MNPQPKGDVRVRFAPSPTGQFHLGSARTALFNWLFAKKNGGTFILRIEDTDKERSKKEFEEQILDSLSWLNLNWDEGPDKEGDSGPYRQSERTEIYRQYLQTLLKEGKVYYCYCTKEELEAQRDAMAAEGLSPKYIGHCRNLKEPPTGKSPQVIRFKMPEMEVEFKDLIRGTVKFDSGLFGDIAIAKDLDNPLYNFSVVVDDNLMKISHVIRGEDHISNTPKQILLARAMEFPEPIFGHLPLILSADRSKLSKRYAETSLLAYRDQGFLPEAVDNFLALLGWHPQGDEEVFALDKLIEIFDIKRVQKAGAIFNEEKLKWLNGEHLKFLSTEKLAELIRPMLKEKIENEKLLRVVEATRERMKTLQDFLEFGGFFFELPEYDRSLLVWQKDAPEKTEEILKKSSEILNAFSGPWPSQEEILSALDPLIAKYGKGSVLWPVRVAISGKSASPDPINIIYALGKDESVRRISLALSKLNA